MSKRYVRSLLTVPAAVVAAVFGVTTALATATWTVRPGGGVTWKSGTLVVADTKTGSTTTCSSSQLEGGFGTGSGHPGTEIGILSVGSFTGCTSPLGLRYTIVPTYLPWRVNVTSYHATTGVVAGNVSHVQIQVSSLPCDAVIDGTSATASDGVVTFTYTNSTAKLTSLTTGGNLHFYDISGCAGLFNNGDPATLRATFAVSPRQTITSP